MKATYRVLAYLIAVGVVVQAAAIAWGFFTLGSDIDNGKVLDKASLESYSPAGLAIHGMNGQMIIPLLALILMIVSFFAKVPGGVKWAGFILLDVVVQVALAFVSFGAASVGMLHGINALVLLGLAIYAGRRVSSPGAADLQAATSRVAV